MLISEIVCDCKTLRSGRNIVPTVQAAARGAGGTLAGRRCRPSTSLSIKNITSYCSLFCIKLLSASAPLAIEHYLEAPINHYNNNYETPSSHLFPKLAKHFTNTLNKGIVPKTVFENIIITRTGPRTLIF